MTPYSVALRVLSWLLSTVGTFLVVAALWLPADWWRLFAGAVTAGVIAAAASNTADEQDHRATVEERVTRS